MTGDARRSRRYLTGLASAALVVTILLSALAPLQAAVGQEKTVAKIPRIGYVVPGPAGCDAPGDAWLRIREAFLDGLKQSGLEPGKNVHWQPQCYQGTAMAQDSVTDVLRQEPDVLVVGGNAAALAAQRQTMKIPVVFAAVGDPVAVGLVPNLGRPSGNVTGISNMSGELVGKRIQLLSDVVPRLRRVAVLLDPVVARSSPHVWSWAEEAARGMAITLNRFEASSADELDDVFTRIAASGAQGLLVLPGNLTWVERPRIFRLALKYRLPSIGQSGVEYGALMSYDSSLREVYRNAAKYVGRVLAGEKPGDLPIQQPTIFELELNLETARSLGVTIPSSLLLRADRVIGR